MIDLTTPLTAACTGSGWRSEKCFTLGISSHCRGSKTTPLITLSSLCRSVVLGMGDGSMTTLTIADPTKPGITEYLKSLPSRNPEKVLLSDN